MLLRNDYFQFLKKLVMTKSYLKLCLSYSNDGNQNIETGWEKISFFYPVPNSVYYAVFVKNYFH